MRANLSTPRLEGWGLLEVRPEPRLSTSPSKAGLRAVERANGLRGSEVPLFDEGVETFFFSINVLWKKVDGLR